MLTQEQFTRISQTLPILQHADPQLLRDFQAQAFHAHIPAGRDVFAEGDEAQAIELLLAGVVRVYKISETGREISPCLTWKMTWSTARNPRKFL